MMLILRLRKERSARIRLPHLQNTGPYYMPIELWIMSAMAKEVAG